MLFWSVKRHFSGLTGSHNPLQITKLSLTEHDLLAFHDRQQTRLALTHTSGRIEY